MQGTRWFFCFFLSIFLSLEKNTNKVVLLTDRFIILELKSLKQPR